MSNNFRRHLEFELAERLEEASELKSIADKFEETWRSITSHRIQFEEAFRKVLALEVDAKERFRGAHRNYVSVKQIVGEIQSEIFEDGGQIE